MTTPHESRSRILTTHHEFERAHHFYDFEGLTIQHIFHNNCKLYSERPYLGVREFDAATKQYGEYKYLKYKEVEEIVGHFGSGLRTIGIQTGDKVGIMAKNCLEYGLTDHACGTYGIVLVPVYNTYGPIDCQYIIEHSEIRAMICSPDHLQFISQVKNSGAAPNLEFIISMDDARKGYSGDLPEGATHMFSQLIEIGKKNHVEETVLRTTDLFSIVYTSGTTGSPKGVLITQNSTAIASMMMGSVCYPNNDPDDPEVCLSYLPLAHIFGRQVDLTLGTWGGKVAYFTGSAARLVDDLHASKSTVLPGVPRVFIKIYDQIQAQVASQPFYKRWVFNTAYYAQKSSLEKYGVPSGWANKLVFKAIQNLFGGKIRYIYNGGSALSFKVRVFLSVCFGTIIGEGYGMTEGSGCLGTCRNHKFDPDSAGTPFIQTEYMLESLPEMDYSVDDKPFPRGEVLVRGPQLFRGYYKEPELTALSIDPDGWFHTGDVGSFCPGPFTDGGKPQESLHIIDRKKNIFKLAQGEFISADRVEAVLLISPYVAQVIVYGPNSASALVAIVVPQWDMLLQKGIIDWESKSSSSGGTSAAALVKEYWAELEKDKAKAVAEAVKKAEKNEPVVSTDPAAAAAPPAAADDGKRKPEQQGGEILAPLALRRALLADAGAREAMRAFLLVEMRRICETTYGIGNNNNTAEAAAAAGSSGGGNSGGSGSGLSSAKEPMVKRYEIPRGAVICVEEWTDTNRCLTPSQKVRREQVRTVHAEAITSELNRMEEEIGAQTKKGA